MEKIVVQVDADLEDLIPGYLESRRQDVETVLQALENQDFETIRIVGHTMKGTGGGYGFDAITGLGHSLEEAAKGQNGEGIRQKAATLLAYLQSVEVVYK